MKKGFTLIELLVVIAIIGILGSITLALLQSKQAEAYSGGFSSSRSSSASFRSSYTPSVRVSPSGFSSGSYKSSSNYYTPKITQNTPIVTPVVPLKVSAKTQTTGSLNAVEHVNTAPTTVYHRYSANPFNGNFFFWMWLLNRQPTPEVITKVIVATSTATTTQNGK